MAAPRLRAAGTLTVAAILLLSTAAAGDEVGIWDTASGDWTIALSDGDPIDAANGENATTPQIATDSVGRVYIAFTQAKGGDPRTYLARHSDGVTAIWDRDAGNWTTTFSAGDPIDAGAAFWSYPPALAIDSADRVYVASVSYDGAKDEIHLVRYDGADLTIWDQDAGAWTTNFADGDPVDAGTGDRAMAPVLTVDSADRAWLAFRQVSGGTVRLYLSQYDGNAVRAWDHDSLSWTTILTDGDPIDADTGQSVTSQIVQTDAAGRACVMFVQKDAKRDAYLCQFNGTDLRIWDDDDDDWTLTLADGDPIDPLADHVANDIALAIDAEGRAYLLYSQNDGANDRLFLSRYDGQALQTWDQNIAGWSTTLADGDPVDNGMAHDVTDPALAVDAADRVYWSFVQRNDVSTGRVHLGRYAGSAITIWDTDAATWTTTLSNGDPIDGGFDKPAAEPQIAVGPDDAVYVTYLHDSDVLHKFTLAADDYHVYVARYDDDTIMHWDDDAGDWSATPSTADPIDPAITERISGLVTAFDPAGHLYMTYSQMDGGGVQRIFLNRLLMPRAPTVTTANITDISSHTALAGGEVVRPGSAAVTGRGVCWNATGAPTIADAKTVSGTGAGAFDSLIDSLDPNGTYHVRAYATNAVGTGYGVARSFTTSAARPRVITQRVADIAEDSAIVGGELVDTGGARVTAQGVCWNTTGAPTLADHVVTAGTTGSPFWCVISGLDAETTYYARAFATNIQGTGYGDVSTFRTKAAPAPADTTAPPTAPPIPTPELVISITALSTRVNVGDTLSFAVRVRNVGTGAAHDARVHLRLPPETDLVTVRPLGATAARSAPVLTESGVSALDINLGDVAAGGAVATEVVLLANAAGAVRLAATAECREQTQLAMVESDASVLVQDVYIEIVRTFTPINACGLFGVVSPALTIIGLMTLRRWPRGR